MIGVMLLAATIVTNPVVAGDAVMVPVPGQSNAACPGELAPGDDQPDPDVFVVRRDGRIWTSAEPYCGVGGTGYARSMARGLIQSGLTSQVWVAQCAVSGTSILDWTQNIGDALNTPLQVAFGGSTYRNCAEMVLLARRLGIRVIAIAWHQGETSCTQNLVGVQQAKMTMLRARFLSDLGSPLIAGQLAPAFSRVCPSAPLIDSANEAAADAFVSSDGLTTALDNTHFNRASMRALGLRYADAILKVLGWTAH